MIITLYRSRCSIQRADGWHAALWTEYRYEPRPAERRESAAGWIHHRSEAVAIVIDSGFGRLGLDAGSLYYLAERGERHCRLAGEDEILAKKRDTAGPSLFGEDEPPPATATAYPRARHPPERPAGENLTTATAPVIRPDPPWASSNGPAAEPVPFARSGAAIDEADQLRARVGELARQVIEPERARWQAAQDAMATELNRLRAIVARARAQLAAAIGSDDDAEYGAGVVTARAILDGADDAGERPAA